mgnify:CR=1 FL=1
MRVFEETRERERERERETYKYLKCDGASKKQGKSSKPQRIKTTSEIWRCIIITIEEISLKATKPHVCMTLSLSMKSDMEEEEKAEEMNLLPMGTLLFFP